MAAQHKYNLEVRWTGNRGQGTEGYRSYDRSHSVSIAGKQEVVCSSDPVFRGDKTKHNPEELFLAAIASCHMLWYLHLCADNGVVVVDYCDNATGTMLQTEEGGGHFSEVTLHPNVMVRDLAMVGKANELHEKAHQFCFIANSCNFPIRHSPTCKTQDA